MKRLILVVFILLVPLFSYSEDFSWLPHWTKGKNFSEHGDYKNAILEYTLAINLSKSDPRSLFLYNERAQAFLKLRAYEDCLRDSLLVFNSNFSSRKEALRALWQCLFCNLIIDESTSEQKNFKLLSAFEERFGFSNEKNTIK